MQTQHLTTEQEEKVRLVIIRTLELYPKLSLSMLGSHVRPYSRDWRKVLEKMIEAREVKRSVEYQGNRGVFVHSLGNNNSDN